MVVKVLVVDDSGFFRRRVSEILSADPTIQVIGTATNGKEAIDQALALKPDVITMDYEMPLMDGITAVRHIMQRCPTPVLMFSSLTHEGARVTLDALDAGAVDFLPKNFEDISRNPEKVKQQRTGPSDAGCCATACAGRFCRARRATGTRAYHTDCQPQCCRACCGFWRAQAQGLQTGGHWHLDRRAGGFAACIDAAAG